jgi:glycosyltransferase involved in cell wall biosynthesis
MSSVEKIKPFVSVVIPAYNAAMHIAQTIASVQNQSFDDFEIIVVDDCSTDDTVSIVKRESKVDPRIRLIRCRSNFGAPAGPRNIGVREARADWIAFLDADDIWHHKKLELQLAVLAQTKLDFCCTSMMNFKNDEGLNFPKVENQPIEEITFLKQLFRYRTPTSSVVVKKEIIENNLFNERIDYKAREDLDCWLRCLEACKIGVKLCAPLVAYRISSQQISGNKLEMIKRHMLVLSEYRMKNGRSLGVLAVFFTFLHFLSAFYIRSFKRSL